ncbi:mannose-1-phosphate guanylyltransferase/mannose-6-phosphate isomerase [Candidatus Methylopumilus planktonicus]|uniref:mannose-1-phosphate guanylyltransferase/mannose-6-phosphate isomerase n=1 Tax=Candidatus Methylopumilus planktonicus TaxID=1581557 RepID=UPI003BEEEF87
MNKYPHQIVPVILCGGSGTRLWPLSRAGFPKQFLVFSGRSSLFQLAITRVNSLVAEDIAVGETLIVTGEEHRFLALDQLREIPEVSTTLLLEPVGRNTAPALTLAALKAVENGEDPILVVTPADQTVMDGTTFTQTLQQSVRLAADGSIVILGITPDKPETGYGYIKHKGAQGINSEFLVSQFVEKPDLAAAERYLASGDYTWNSGMFVLKASTWLKALAHFRPAILIATQQAFSQKTVDAQFVRPDQVAFTNIPSDSVDCAVLEKCPESAFTIKMVPLNVGWNDLGAWDALCEVSAQDANGNVTHGDTLMTNTSNTFIHASSRLVGTVGVSNLIVVETADAILVADKGQSQHVKKIVSQLVTLKRSEHILPRKVHRPWGWYDSIDEGARFKVKRIQVKPGASLSLQSHQQRAEHWVVVKGTAEVICGDKAITLTENQSTYIPLGELHRLRNPGAIPLEIIEVQSGSYLGEDDIERFDDSYGRL